MTRRHKGELAFDISQRRMGQTLDQRLAVATNALFVRDEQVHRRAKMDLDLLVSDRLHDLDGHAVPCQPPTGDRIRWKNSDSLIDDLARARVLVRRPQRPLRNKCNVAIETHAVVKARMSCRVGVERVSQHGLHRLYPGTSGRNSAARSTPAKPQTRSSKASRSIVRRLTHLSHWFAPPIPRFGGALLAWGDDPSRKRKRDPLSVVRSFGSRNRR